MVKLIYLKSSKHVKNANDKKTQTQREKTIKKTITMESKEKVTKKKKKKTHSILKHKIST